MNRVSVYDTGGVFMIVVKLCKAGKMTLFSPIQRKTILQKRFLYYWICMIIKFQAKAKMLRQENWRMKKYSLEKI